VHYSFCPTAGERYRVTTLLVRRSCLHQGMFWSLVAIPLVIIGFVGLTVAMGTHTLGEAAAAGGLWVSVLACWGLAFVGFPLLRYWNAQGVTRDNPALRGTCEFEFGPDGLVTRTGITESKLGWEAVLEVVETDKFLLFFFSRQCAYFLPKRAIPPDELPVLRGFLRQQASSATRLLDDAGRR